MHSVLYMPALVTKTGTSLPSRTRQFLALQITFRLKRASPLFSFFFFASLPKSLVRSRFQPRVTDVDARQRSSNDLSIDPLIGARSVTSTCYFMTQAVICFQRLALDIPELYARNLWVYCETQIIECQFRVKLLDNYSFSWLTAKWSSR